MIFGMLNPGVQICKILVKFLSEFNVPKSVNFRVLFKNMNVDVFWGHSVAGLFIVQ